MSWLYKKVKPWVKSFFATDQEDDEDEYYDSGQAQQSGRTRSHYASAGTRVTVPVNTEGPVLQEIGDAGGLQGLTWYLDNQRCDEDGDMADAGGFWREERGRMVRRQGVPPKPGQRPRFQGTHQGDLIVITGSGGPPHRSSQGGGGAGAGGDHERHARRPRTSSGSGTKR